MTVGEYIAKLRTGSNAYGKTWTQGELAAELNPPVAQSTIAKLESGYTKNLKRCYIVQLAELFGVSPGDLMRLDEQTKIPEEIQNIDSFQTYMGKDTLQLVYLFYDLNEKGQKKALEIIRDLSEHPKYMNNNKQQ